MVIRYMKLNANAYGGEGHIIYREGRTLYSDTVADDVGLYVAPDAKIVVVQYINGNRVEEQFSDLQSAMGYLVDYYDDPTTSADDNQLNFAGTISAVLNSSGAAEWVVFDSLGGTQPNQNPGGVSATIDEVILTADGSFRLENKNNQNITTGIYRYELQMSGVGGYQTIRTGTVNAATDPYNVSGTPFFTLTSGESYRLIVDGVESETIPVP